MSIVKIISILSATVIVISLVFLYLYIIVGGIPVIEYWYNTIYADEFKQKDFVRIERGMSIDQVTKLLGKPIKIKEFTTVNDDEISVYYYSFMREGSYIGKVGHVYGKIILIKDSIVVKKIDRIMPHTELMTKYISREKIFVQ